MDLLAIVDKVHGIRHLVGRRGRGLRRGGVDRRRGDPGLGIQDLAGGGGDPVVPPLVPVGEADGIGQLVGIDAQERDERIRRGAGVVCRDLLGVPAVGTAPRLQRAGTS